MSSSTALQRQRFNSSSLAMTLHQFDFHLEVRQLDNGSFMAIITGPENVSSTSLLDARRQADKNATGALCYVIAIILIYGLSIIIMIASQIRKNKHDSGVARYMQDIEKVRRLERRHEKFKMRLAMQQNRQVLGQTRGAKALERTSLDWNTTFKGRNYVTRFDSQITAETNDMIDNETIVETETCLSDGIALVSCVNSDPPPTTAVDECAANQQTTNMT